jgi:anti-anti-sigma factor
LTLVELAQPNVRASEIVTSVSDDGVAVVVTLRGEVDIFTLPLVVEVLTRAIADHDGPIVVDLAYTEFIDSTTARTLARAWQFLDDRGRTLTLRSPSRGATRVLGLLGLAHLTESGPTLRSA